MVPMIVLNEQIDILAPFERLSAWSPPLRLRQDREVARIILGGRRPPGRLPFLPYYGGARPENVADGGGEGAQGDGRVLKQRVTGELGLEDLQEALAEQDESNELHGRAGRVLALPGPDDVAGGGDADPGDVAGVPAVDTG